MQTTGTELIDLTFSDSEDEIAILPSPQRCTKSFLDISRPIKLSFHEEIPVKVLVPFVQGNHSYARRAFVPNTVAKWCNFKFETH